MRLLLDTHALLWWAFDAPELSRRAAALLADRSNTVFVSAASAWEISTKYRLGKLPEASVLVSDMSEWFASAGLVELPITIEHARRAGQLEGIHRDPFDRMLSAQSLADGLPIVGCDEALKSFGVHLIW